MRSRRIATLTFVFLAVAFAGKKKNPDDVTQTLELPKEPPMVAVGETSRLTFQVSPLSAKGLLSQQTRDALKAILRQNGNSQIVHLRAFVAGSGDLRRIPQIVSEVLGGKKTPLPSVSVVLVGALPLADAQIVIEAVSEGKKAVNPDGLTFFAAQPQEKFPVADILQMTCFVHDAANPSRLPSSLANVVQMQRTPSQPGTNCEAIARGGSTKAPKLAFSGTQIAFGNDQKASDLAFQHLYRDLEAEGAEKSSIVSMNVYALSERGLPSALSIIPAEGVASVDGRFAVDAVAAISK